MKRVVFAAACVVALSTFGTGRAVAAGDLVGTFRLTSGNCTGGAHGSYFRMINPTGNASGPFVSNSDSGCGDKTYTLLTGGSDGGLVTGGYQPAPSPGFDSDGNSLASRVIRPVRFFGVDFSASTEPKDLQTGASNPAPRLSFDASGAITGDTRGFDATWNNQSFNQGAPKPDGSKPGITSTPTGTYDAATGKFVVTWMSQIVGGPFNNFTGVWHLEGTFVAASGGAAAGGAATSRTTAARSGRTSPTTVVADARGDATPNATVAGETVRRVAGKPIVHKGWEAPTGLVLVVALVGIAAVVGWVLLDRREDEVVS